MCAGIGRPPGEGGLEASGRFQNAGRPLREPLYGGAGASRVFAFRLVLTSVWVREVLALEQFLPKRRFLPQARPRPVVTGRLPPGGREREARGGGAEAALAAGMAGRGWPCCRLCV